MTLALPLPSVAAPDIGQRSPVRALHMRPRQSISEWAIAQATVKSPSVDSVGKWRLVRTPGPDRKGDTISIMHAADALQSDPDFAGIMIRCQSNSVLQIAFVLITPFPPHSHPEISMATTHGSVHFQADVIPPGSMLAIPNEAEALVKGPWQSAKELTVDIQGEGAKIHGIVSLDQLADAVTSLQANCSQ